MPTEANQPCEYPVRSESIAKTHGASLAEPSKKDPLANLFLAILDAFLPPVFDLASYVSLNDGQTVFDFVDVVSVLIIASPSEALNIVPTVVVCPVVDGYFALRSVEQVDLCSFECR
jgi:hypothetical protein